MMTDAARNLNNLENLSISHNYREANTLANRVADEAAYLEGLQIWEGDFAERFMELALKDLHDHPS